jgi:hypothetical protein
VSQRASGLIGEDSMVAEELSQLYIDLMLALEVRPPVRIQCGATHADLSRGACRSKSCGKRKRLWNRP